MSIPNNEIVRVSIDLATTVASQQGFGSTLVITDDAQVPVDLRVRTISKTGYATALTGAPLGFASNFFSQSGSPQSFKLARYVSVASSPYWTSGSSLSASLTAWQALTSVSLVVHDSDSHVVTMSGLNFGSITALSQIPGIFNTALDGLTTPAITGLEDARFRYDATGRLVLEHLAVSGASAVTIHVDPVATTAGLRTALDATNGLTVLGHDVETPAACLDAIRELTVDFWPVCELAMDEDDQVLLAQACESYPLFCALRSVDADSVNVAIDTATDVGTRVLDLALTKTKVYYTGVTTEYPQAAVIARYIQELEGSIAWKYKELSNISESGNGANLTTVQKQNLSAKHIDWIDTVGGTMRTNLSSSYEGTNYSAVTAGGKEIHQLLARDFAEARIQEGVLTLLMTNNILAFDDFTLAGIENVVRSVGQILLARRVIVDTADRPMEYNFPSAADFTAAQRASHVMTLADVFTWPANSSVSEFSITGAMVI